MSDYEPRATYDPLREALSESERRAERLRALLREVLAQGVEYGTPSYAVMQVSHSLLHEIHAALSAAPLTVAPPRAPTQAMLDAARDWSQRMYGKPIGNEAATGCWQAMLAAAPQDEATPPREDARIADLAMLVRRMARGLGEHSQIAQQANDYLRRHGLDGSPLRTAAQEAHAGAGE